MNAPSVPFFFSSAFVRFLIHWINWTARSLQSIFCPGEINYRLNSLSNKMSGSTHETQEDFKSQLTANIIKIASKAPLDLEHVLSSLNCPLLMGLFTQYATLACEPTSFLQAVVTTVGAISSGIRVKNPINVESIPLNLFTHLIGEPGMFTSGTLVGHFHRGPCAFRDAKVVDYPCPSPCVVDVGQALPRSLLKDHRWSKAIDVHSIRNRAFHLAEDGTDRRLICHLRWNRWISLSTRCFLGRWSNSCAGWQNDVSIFRSDSGWNPRHRFQHAYNPVS